MFTDGEVPVVTGYRAEELDGFTAPIRHHVLDILVHTNDELTSFMVQSMFWGTHRQEDIVKESKGHNISKSPDLYFSSISTEAASFLQGLVEGCNEKIDEGKKKIRELATMPIVSTNNRCESALIYGLVDILKLYQKDMKKEMVDIQEL